MPSGHVGKTPVAKLLSVEAGDLKALDNDFSDDVDLAVAMALNATALCCRDRSTARVRHAQNPDDAVWDVYPRIATLSKDAVQTVSVCTQVFDMDRNNAWTTHAHQRVYARHMRHKTHGGSSLGERTGLSTCG